MSNRKRKRPRKRADQPVERPGRQDGVRAENRRQRLADLSKAAVALFLRRGLEAVTIDEITGAADVAKGSYYRYFEDKTALVDWLYAPVHERLVHAFRECRSTLDRSKSPSDSTVAYMALGQSLAEIFFSERDLTHLYLQECRGAAAGARLPISRIAKQIEEGAIDLTRVAQEHGLQRTMDPGVSALTVVGAVERLTFAWLTGTLTAEPAVLVPELVRMVLQGIAGT